MLFLKRLEAETRPGGMSARARPDQKSGDELSDRRAIGGQSFWCMGG